MVLICTRTSFSSFSALSTKYNLPNCHLNSINNSFIYNLIRTLNRDPPRLSWERKLFPSWMTSGVTFWIWYAPHPYVPGMIYYRCKQFPANRVHMFWTCLWLTDFWSRVFDTLKQDLNPCLAFPQDQTCQLQHGNEITIMLATHTCLFSKMDSSCYAKINKSFERRTNRSIRIGMSHDFSAGNLVKVRKKIWILRTKLHPFFNPIQTFTQV